ncbi:MAG: hypothetical protein AABX54_01135 [Nanoarchaeota archaeon]
MKKRVNRNRKKISKNNLIIGIAVIILIFSAGYASYKNSSNKNPDTKNLGGELNTVGPIGEIPHTPDDEPEPPIININPPAPPDQILGPFIPEETVKKLFPGKSVSEYACDKRGPPEGSGRCFYAVYDPEDKESDVDGCKIKYEPDDALCFLNPDVAANNVRCSDFGWCLDRGGNEETDCVNPAVFDRVRGYVPNLPEIIANC